METLTPFQIVGLILGSALGLLAVWLLFKKWVVKLPPMYPLPIQTIFIYFMVFTSGVLVLSTRSPGSMAYGLLLCFVGLSIFLPEQTALRFAGIYLLLIIMCLLDVWGRLQINEPFFQPRKMTEWWAGGFGLVWGLGILFAWHRWHTGRTANMKDAEDPPNP